MTNKLNYVSIALAVASLFAGTIQAQDLRRADADIPFAFYAEGLQMPAGRYCFTEMQANGLSRLTNQTTRHEIFLRSMTPTGGEPRGSKLVFHCYGDDCILAEVWYEGDCAGRALPRHAKEKELASAARKTVTLAMR